MAAAPATIGAAPEVPPKAEVAVKPPESAEIEAPGAAISGLTMLSSKRGPREDVDASEPASGSWLVGEKRTAAFPGRSTFASTWLIMNAGIEGTPAPSAPAKGTSELTRPIMLRMAPAAARFETLTLNEQMPRSTSTMRPASSPAAYGEVTPSALQPRR